MRRPFRRPGGAVRPRPRTAFAASAVGALVLSAGIVWHSAYASFTDSTPTTSTTISTGSVVLGDDDAGTTLFSLAGLKPGAAATRCITVTSTGSVPALVRFYGANKTTSKSLSSNLTVAVLSGSGGTSTDCSGFTPATSVYRGTLAALPTSFAGGVGDWPTAGGGVGESRSYEITVSMPSSASSGSQAGTAGVAFTWEAQSQGTVR